MKKLILILSAALAVFVLPLAAAQPLVKSGDLVVVAGDSITEQKQYSVFIEDYILMCARVPEARVIQFGWSGDKIDGFRDRQMPSLKLFKPQVVTTLFGMNDGRYEKLRQGTIDLYRKATADVVRELKKDGEREIFVGTPGIVGRDEYRKPASNATVYNKSLYQLGQLGKEVAEQEGVHWVDVHSVMADVEAKAKEKYGDKYHLAGSDGIHPGANGHLVMAYAFLKAMGFDGHIGTITVDMRAGKAEATEGHEVLGVKNGAVEVRSERYPFCFYGDETSPASPKGVLDLLPFNEDLNRFMLVVKNAPSQKVRVTWGDSSAEFTAKELAEGVNLAAAFVDKNPFSTPFLKVHDKARAQQNYETPAVKVLLQSFVEFGKLLPEVATAESATFERLGKRIVERAFELCDETGAAIEPVTHAIKLEPVR